MSKQLRGLQSRKATLVKDTRAMTDFAAAEKRNMNDINEQETFSRMAPILGLSAMHERRREQFAGYKW